MAPSDETSALLDDARLEPKTIRSCRRRLTAFLERYLPCFYRQEQRVNARIVLEGCLSDLERKTSEPIAIRFGIQRKPIQKFVGWGAWDDQKVMAEMRRHIREEIAHPEGVLVLDPSSFAKKGTHSVGVKRQWCGRLGKVENSQLAVFLAYVASGCHAPLDRRLYLPKEWADDPVRRRAARVPQDIAYQTTWQIAADMIEAHGKDFPHAWVAGDDELGRPAAFRAWLREKGERYVLDVPSNTLVKDLERAGPRRKQKKGRRRGVPFLQARAWAAMQPAERWERFRVRDGEKGPLSVMALSVEVRAKQDRRVGPQERLVVTRTVEKNPQTSFLLTNAAADVPLLEILKAKAARHAIESLFEEAKGETGLAHYEVRSWVGWHHHVTLSLLALWFLILEKRRIGGKNTRHQRPAGPTDLLAAAS